MSVESAASSTKRPLGFWMCAALVVGNMIGSGVFLLPAALAPLGWSAVVGWLVTIAGALALAVVFARLAGAFPREGGPYAFAREAFGPAPSFLVAWSYWISVWVGNAAVATGSVSYLSVFLPQIADTQGLHAAITVGVIWLLTLVNCLGAKEAGRLQIITTVLKLLPLIAVVGLAIMVLGREGPVAAIKTPFDASTITFAGVTAAATLTLWAFLGLETATVPADKVNDPGRTIARATILGTAVAGFVYLFACSAVTLMQPAETVATSTAPFADFVAPFWGDGARATIAAFAAISGFGALNGWILIQGELPYAMARGGVFPAWFAKATANGTPMRAHLVSSTLLTIVVLMNYSKSMTELFTFIVLISTSASLVMFLISALAALKLSADRRLKAGLAFIIVACLAAIYSVWAITGAGLEALAWYFALLAAGAPIYLWARRAVAVST